MMLRARLPRAAAAVALGVLVAGPVAAGANARHRQIKPPANIAKTGKIVYCSDITYPPEEFYKGAEATGSDVDIGTNIAKRMGVKAQFVNTTFDSIIPALLSKKCDAIISGMNDTALRRKQVNFVDYISVGQSFMVRKGNPLHITRVSDLSGKTAGVESGTTNKTYLDAQNAKLQAQGKKPITIVTFPKDTDAATALRAGKIDAYFADTPVVAWYVSRNANVFSFGGKTVNPIPVGIALRKQDRRLRADVQTAVSRMYRDGTMKRILAKWKLSFTALKK
jgi:polar amino acid transport system substrate-binding protein